VRPPGRAHLMWGPSPVTALQPQTVAPHGVCRIALSRRSSSSYGVGRVAAALRPPRVPRLCQKLVASRLVTSLPREAGSSFLLQQLSPILDQRQRWGRFLLHWYGCQYALAVGRDIVQVRSNKPEPDAQLNVAFLPERTPRHSSKG
jgi:hypothetical protein